MAKVEGRFCDIVLLQKFFTLFRVEKLTQVLHDQDVESQSSQRELFVKNWIQ